MAHWVTPQAIMNSGKHTALGEVNYGVESRMFVFAFRDTDINERVTDTSIPAYNNIVELTPAERTQFLSSKYIIIEPNSTVNRNTTEVPLMYRKEGVELDSGLRLASNGQIVGRLEISDSLKELVFKVQYTDPPRYQLDTKYLAYSHVEYNGRLYRLNMGVTLPYYARDGAPSQDDWTDIGAYNPQYTDIADYTVGSQYNVNSQVRYGANAYRLTSKINNELLASSSSPTAEYWSDLGVYDAERYLPSQVYRNGRSYVLDQYVSHGGIVYRCIVQSITTTTSSPDSSAWTAIGPVSTLPTYAQGTVYSMSDHVRYGTHVYQLVYTQPYIATTTAPDSHFWDDLGSYEGALETSLTRVFRIVINTRRSNLIDFQTGSGLGILRIGQPLGEAINKDIIATSTNLMSYELLDAHRNIIGVENVKDDAGIYRSIPKGLTLQPDGLVTGHPVGPVGTYSFDVIAQNTAGLEKQQTFEVQVAEGFAAETLRASLRPRFDVERRWYDMISNSAFNEVKLYRPSDPNYGLVDFPYVTLKNNLRGDYQNNILDFDVVRALVNSKLGNTPAIECRVGNMRYRVALDSSGAPLYEVIYKELVPLSQSVQYDANAQNETTATVNDIITLKQRLVDLLGSDDTYVSADPLRGHAINQSGIIYYDDLPLWQSNPDKTNNAVEGALMVMPVAFVQPGEASKFISLAIEYGALTDMYLNEIIQLDQIVLQSQASEVGREIVVPLSCD